MGLQRHGHLTSSSKRSVRPFYRSWGYGWGWGWGGCGVKTAYHQTSHHIVIYRRLRPICSFYINLFSVRYSGVWCRRLEHQTHIYQKPNYTSGSCKWIFDTLGLSVVFWLRPCTRSCRSPTKAQPCVPLISMMQRQPFSIHLIKAEINYSVQLDSLGHIAAIGILICNISMQEIRIQATACNNIVVL